MKKVKRFSHFWDYLIKSTLKRNRNRFKGLDLIDRVPDELWVEVRDMVQEQGSGPSPRKRNAKKQNGYLKRPYE